MNQPVASVAPEDVHRLVARDFDKEQHEAVWALLLSCGTEPHGRGDDRVRAAVLRLADGQLDRLERAVRLAKADYRDALVAAEYPLFSQRTSATQALSEDERAELYEADWKQYDEWFRRAVR